MLAGCIFLQRAGAPKVESLQEFGPLPVVCACFGVGLGAIRDAMLDQTTPSAEAIGRALRAGTRCGSCLPELRSLAHERLAHAS